MTALLFANSCVFRGWVHFPIDMVYKHVLYNLNNTLSHNCLQIIVKLFVGIIVIPSSVKLCIVHNYLYFICLLLVSPSSAPLLMKPFDSTESLCSGVGESDRSSSSLIPPEMGGAEFLFDGNILQPPSWSSSEASPGTDHLNKVGIFPKGVSQSALSLFMVKNSFLIQYERWLVIVSHPFLSPTRARCFQRGTQFLIRNNGE